MTKMTDTPASEINFSEYTVNLGGHNKSSFDDVKFDDLNDHQKRFVKFRIEEEIRWNDIVNENSDDTDEKVKVKKIRKKFRIGTDQFTCEHCSKKFYVDVDLEQKTVKTFIRDQETFEQIDTVCKYPNGFPEFSVQINVPSGKLVFGNDFRNLITLDDDHDTNQLKERIRFSKDHAGVGLVLIFVGNTCPGVYRKDGQILIMNPDYDHETDDYKEDPTREELGSICTDLWWFSAMDYDHFMKAQEELKNDDPEDYEEVEFDDNTFIVNVEPGRYEFTSRHHLLDDRDVGEQLYSVGKRIGDCVVAETLEEIETGDALLDSFLWKSWLKDKKRYRMFSNMTDWAEHRFCALGNGYDWDRGVLRSSRREDKRWANLEGKFSGLYEEGQKPLRHGTAIYDQIPAWSKQGIEKFRGDGKYRYRDVYPMCREYVNAGNMPEKVDIFYLAFAMMFFKMLYENQHILTDNSDQHKVGGDKYGTEEDPNKKGMLLKIGTLTQEDVDALNKKTRDEQVAIVNGCLDMMFALVIETNRYSELLSVFKLFDRDFVMKEMGG